MDRRLIPAPPAASNGATRIAHLEQFGPASQPCALAGPYLLATDGCRTAYFSFASTLIAATAESRPPNLLTSCFAATRSASDTSPLPR